MINFRHFIQSIPAPIDEMQGDQGILSPESDFGHFEN